MARLRCVSTSAARAPRQDMDRTDQVDAIRMAARHAAQMHLRAAVVHQHMVAGRAGLARILRTHRKGAFPAPRHLSVNWQRNAV